ncbi:MAG TPA: hypothetical protein VKD47_02335 [Miltoncostaeaceae bacterium]|nr:hypothetical protein [Miltoncostaeaceae bacterium]
MKRRARRAAIGAAMGFVMTAMRDRRTRSAARQAVKAGRGVVKDMSGMRPGPAIARAARDPGMQEQLAALTRAGAAAWDASVQANRRSRRRWVTLLLAGGGTVGGAVAALLGRQRAKRRAARTEFAVPGLVPSERPVREPVRSGR